MSWDLVIFALTVAPDRALTRSIGDRISAFRLLESTSFRVERLAWRSSL